MQKRARAWTRRTSYPSYSSACLDTALSGWLCKQSSENHLLWNSRRRPRTPMAFIDGTMPMKPCILSRGSVQSSLRNRYSTSSMFRYRPS